MKKIRPTSFQQIFEFYNSKKEPNISDFTENNTPAFQDYNGKLLVHDENLNCLKNLLNNGYSNKIDLIYIDPPFGIGKRFENKKSGFGFDDKITGSAYLQFMYERLILLRELLSDEGSIYLHCDWHKSHHLRFLLDEVFGEENFVNEVVWCYTGVTPSPRNFKRKHDTILLYSKNKEEYIFNSTFRPYKALNATKKLSHGSKKESTPETMNELLDRGTALEDWWDDVYTADRVRNEMENYPTQKPEALLERIVKASSNEGSIVLDCFAGSGTTAAVAERLGRRWITADVSIDSIKVIKKRLNLEL